MSSLYIYINKFINLIDFGPPLPSFCVHTEIPSSFYGAVWILLCLLVRTHWHTLFVFNQYFDPCEPLFEVVHRIVSLSSFCVCFFSPLSWCLGLIGMVPFPCTSYPCHHGSFSTVNSSNVGIQFFGRMRSASSITSTAEQ